MVSKSSSASLIVATIVVDTHTHSLVAYFRFNIFIRLIMRSLTDVPADPKAYNLLVCLTLNFNFNSQHCDCGEPSHHGCSLYVCTLEIVFVNKYFATGTTKFSPHCCLLLTTIRFVSNEVVWKWYEPTIAFCISQEYTQCLTTYMMSQANG